jgi:multimeric flavodoxin WrbA
MSYVLAIQASPRQNGYTSGLLNKAVEGLKCKGVEVHVIRLRDYKLEPCSSCFFCVRDSEHRCVMKDDMGSMGEGKLIPEVMGANGIILADPVYCWTMSARTHLFFERLYPLQWTGKLSGMPFAVITCATNQGFMRESLAQITKLAFTYKFRYVDGLAVHASYYDEALTQAKDIGMRLALEAQQDAIQRRLLGDEEAFSMYEDSSWAAAEYYLHNLSANPEVGGWHSSLLYQLDTQGRFNSYEGAEHLHKASVHLREALRAKKLGQGETFFREVAAFSAHWTEATWNEYVKNYIKGKKPDAYRPVITELVTEQSFQQSTDRMGDSENETI